MTPATKKKMKRALASVGIGAGLALVISAGLQGFGVGHPITAISHFAGHGLNWALSGALKLPVLILTNPVAFGVTVGIVALGCLAKLAYNKYKENQGKDNPAPGSEDKPVDTATAHRDEDEPPSDLSPAHS